MRIVSSGVTKSVHADVRQRQHVSVDEDRFKRSHLLALYMFVFAIACPSMRIVSSGVTL